MLSCSRTRTISWPHTHLTTPVSLHTNTFSSKGKSNTPSLSVFHFQPEDSQTSINIRTPPERICCRLLYDSGCTTIHNNPWRIHDKSKVVQCTTCTTCSVCLNLLDQPRLFLVLSESWKRICSTFHFNRLSSLIFYQHCNA